MTPPQGWRAKDFTLVKHDGEFHVFYLRHESALPFELTENDLGHAVSRDLYVWNHMPPVIPARDDSWDRHHIWAPSIVCRDSVYYMFYTGVTDEPGTPGGSNLWQRTGIATSTDLYNWNRLDQPILTCESIPWMYCDSTVAVTAFRDPCVVPDPTQPGRWLMVYTASPATDSSKMVAGLATSDGDFEVWQDHSPLWISHATVTGNGLVESPSLFTHGSRSFLFWTTSNQQQLHYAVSPDPAGDPGLWSYRGSLAGLLGYDTSPWFASEYMRDGLVEYFGFVNGDRVDVREMKWMGGDSTFTLQQPDVFHVVRMHWSVDTVRVGDTLSVTIESANGYGRPLPYELVAIAPDGFESILEPSTIGAGDAPTLWSSPLTWTWVVQALPDTVPGGVMPQMVIRTTDRTCISPPLHLVAPDPPPPPPPPRRPAHPGPGGAMRPVGPWPDLRQIAIHEFSARPQILVDMPAAAAVRLDLFDVSGRRLRTLAERTLDIGANVIEWDGRDRDGRRVGSGLYFARLIVAGERPVVARVLIR